MRGRPRVIGGGLVSLSDPYRPVEPVIEATQSNAQSNNAA